MILGLFTACLNEPLESIASWAASEGFQALEIACWPRRSERDYAGCHIDVASPQRRELAQAAKATLQKHSLEASSLGFYDNNLHPDSARRAAIHAHLKAVIDAASAMQCQIVGTFIGRHPGKNLKENVDEMAEVFPPLLDYAGERGIKLVIENCPMLNWQSEGLIGNIASTPVMWEAMFDQLPQPNFGLNLDPSHLLWQGIDYVAAVREFAPRIFHAHAKDTEILRRRLERSGNVLSHVHGHQWWRYRMPGMGEINWRDFISAMLECGLDHWLSIEHEDPVWEGSPQKVRDGLLLGLRHLSTCLP